MSERGDGLEKFKLGQFSESSSDPTPIDKAKLGRANRRLQEKRLAEEGLRRKTDRSYEIPLDEETDDGAKGEKPEIRKAA
ncbi:MAG: hypothetical protein WC497_01775 [Patescibacteria group bacterium]